MLAEVFVAAFFVGRDDPARFPRRRFEGPDNFPGFKSSVARIFWMVKFGTAGEGYFYDVSVVVVVCGLIPDVQTDLGRQ